MQGSRSGRKECEKGEERKIIARRRKRVGWKERVEKKKGRRRQWDQAVKIQKCRKKTEGERVEWRGKERGRPNNPIILFFMYGVKGTNDRVKERYFFPNTNTHWW